MIDIAYLKNMYFVFDKPVPYSLKCGATLNIRPVMLVDSMIFTSSYEVLDIDKNQSDDVEIIQMSYLNYLYKYALNDNLRLQQMINICLLCLGFTIPYIRLDENGKAILCNIESHGDAINELFSITSKEFDEIRRIILYQNMPDYDDSYIDPELKSNMEEMDRLLAKDVVPPSLERKLGIISAHTGMSKAEQLSMTLRAHTILFEEVVGEVDYLTGKPVAMTCGKSKEVQWIYKKSKNKFDDYITSVEKYNKSMGGDGAVSSKTVQNSKEDFSFKYDNFIGG